MEFALSPEQKLLQDSVARMIADNCDFDAARRQMKAGGKTSASLWTSLAELGLPALTVPEECGGMGGSLVDAAICVEQFGRGLAATPFVTTCIASALVLAGAEASPRRRMELEAIAEGRRFVALAVEERARRYRFEGSEIVAVETADGFELAGRKILAIDGAEAHAFIVSARIGGRDGEPALFLAPADVEGLERRAYQTIDGRNAADLVLDGARLGRDDLLARGRAAEALLEKALDAARLMFAAEAIGLMETAIEATTDYMKVRQQFGRPLVSFQVLTHRVADMLVRKEHARSMLYRGLSFMDADDAARARAVSATMASILQAGEFVGGQAIQLHGGIGMSEDYPVGHYYKRLRAIGKTFGDLPWHMARYCRTSAQGGQRHAG